MAALRANGAGTDSEDDDGSDFDDGHAAGEAEMPAAAADAAADDGDAAGGPVRGGVVALPRRASDGGGGSGGARSRLVARRAQRQQRQQRALLLLRELLRRDYAVGYLLLAWLARASWTLLPAAAQLLGLPVTRDAARRQLPALLLWLASAGDESAAAVANEGVELAGQEVEQRQQLDAAQLAEELADAVAGPPAALAAFADALRAQQALQGAPATMQQVSAHVLRTEETGRLCVWKRLANTCLLIPFPLHSHPPIAFPQKITTNAKDPRRGRRCGGRRRRAGRRA